MSVGWFFLGVAGAARLKWLCLTWLSSSFCTKRLTWACASRTGRALGSKPNCASTFQPSITRHPLTFNWPKETIRATPESMFREAYFAQGVRASIPKQWLVRMCDHQGVAMFWFPPGSDLLDCPDPGFWFQFQSLKWIFVKYPWGAEKVKSHFLSS